jgi:hypothetical protein
MPSTLRRESLEGLVEGSFSPAQTGLEVEHSILKTGGHTGDTKRSCEAARALPIRIEDARHWEPRLTVSGQVRVSDNPSCADEDDWPAAFGEGQREKAHLRLTYVTIIFCKRENVRVKIINCRRTYADSYPQSLRWREEAWRTK